MQSFLDRHASEIKGTLMGIDRCRFRGTIRWLSSVRGLMSYLWSIQVRLTQFTDWAKGLTKQVVDTSERIAETAGRPMIYLYSSSDRKENLAATIAQEDGIKEGLICVFKCVEPAETFKVGPNPKTKRLELRKIRGKCSHYYFYMMHPQLGLVHLRLQSWLPFTMHVCLNGRQWLARQLCAAGIGFEQRDNCFVQVDDMAAAQALLEQQLQTDWGSLLDGLRQMFHPVHDTMFGKQKLDVYWSGEETECATDIIFRSPEALARIYPQLVRHAMTAFSSGDVLRFLGRCPQVRRYRTSEIQTTHSTRPEGICVKHRVDWNSIKFYDKQLCVLRIETTINYTRDMKVFRAKEGDPQGPKSWQRLRKGVADLYRRIEISRQANERYLEALASVEHEQPLGECVRDVCEPADWNGRRVRALQPLSSGDGQLLSSVNRGEFAINGFRNRDLRAVLFGTAEADPAETRRQAARVTRLIRILRGHRLIKKVPKTHRYVLTTKGRLKITALLIAQQASSQELAQLAA